MENYNVLTGIKGVNKVKEEKKLEDPISFERLSEIVDEDIYDQLCARLNPGEEIEIVIPAAGNNCDYKEDRELFSNLTFYSKCIKNGIVYHFYDDFWSFKGHPYTDEAKEYLYAFNKIDCLVTKNNVGTGRRFAVWYKIL